MAKRYAVITTLSMFRHRYVMEMDEDETDPVPYQDFVTCEDVEEFSQASLPPETITDTVIMTEEEVLAQFDKDHIETNSEIFLDWPDETKLRNVLRPDQRETGNALHKKM